jgi:DNA-binding response OmpR family regulator
MTTPPKLLIVEDEPDLLRGLRDNFELEGYQVCCAADGDAGLRIALEQQPDLVILDVMLPRRGGVELCRDLRAAGFSAPIIMLTARSQETDKVIGLEAGADDYVTKPFGLRELLARVRAQLRRLRPARPAGGTIRSGALVWNPRTREACWQGARVALSPREFDLLGYFARHAGEVVSRQELLDQVWGLENYPLTRTVDNHVARLRQKLTQAGAHADVIATAHRLGYRFTPDA